VQWFFRSNKKWCQKHQVSIYSTTFWVDWFIEKSLGQPIPLLQYWLANAKATNMTKGINFFTNFIAFLYLKIKNNGQNSHLPYQNELK